MQDPAQLACTDPAHQSEAPLPQCLDVHCCNCCSHQQLRACQHLCAQQQPENRSLRNSTGLQGWQRADFQAAWCTDKGLSVRGMRFARDVTK